MKTPTRFRIFALLGLIALLLAFGIMVSDWGLGNRVGMFVFLGSAVTAVMSLTAAYAALPPAKHRSRTCHQTSISTPTTPARDYDQPPGLWVEYWLSASSIRNAWPNRK